MVFRQGCTALQGGQLDRVVRSECPCTRTMRSGHPSISPSVRPVPGSPTDAACPHCPPCMQPHAVRPYGTARPRHSVQCQRQAAPWVGACVFAHSIQPWMGREGRGSGSVQDGRANGCCVPPVCHAFHMIASPCPARGWQWQDSPFTVAASTASALLASSARSSLRSLPQLARPGLAAGPEVGALASPRCPWWSVPAALSPPFPSFNMRGGTGPDISVV